QQLMIWIPRSFAVFGIDRKRMLCIGLRIIVLKEINHFLNTHRIFWNGLPVVYKSSNICVRRIIYIDRKRRNRIRLCTFKRVFLNRFVRFAIYFNRRKHFLNFLVRNRFLFFLFSFFSAFFLSSFLCGYIYHSICSSVTINCGS